MISTTYNSGASTSAVAPFSTTYQSGSQSDSMVAPISTTYRSGSQSTCPSNSGAQSAM
ncbi:hypothetical protein RDWZM_007397, partial [Blomia tropicalis]